MDLKQLSDSGPAGFAEWREMWNDEILPYLRSLRPVAGPGVRIDRRTNGTIIRTLPPLPAPAASPGRSGYESYFKLTLAGSAGSGGTTYTVTVADGATGGNSVAVVNGFGTYSLAPYTETVSANRLFFLKYTPAQYGSGGAPVSSATMVISSIASDTLPAGGTDGAYYMQLGRVVGSSGGTLRVVQDHTAGVAKFDWYADCRAGY